MEQIHVGARERVPISPDLRARLAVLPTAAISDCLSRDAGLPGLAAIGGSLGALNGGTLVGIALTVRTRVGDNLALHVALDESEPGDVIVVDARGALTHAILGDLIAAYAGLRGVAGLVVDGAVRDVATIAGTGGIPVFARGVSHQGPYKDGPGEVHCVVSLCGRPVADGDVVVGDADGVVVIPRSSVETVVVAAEAIVDSERRQLQDISNGTWQRAWIRDRARIVRAVDTAPPARIHP